MDAINLTEYSLFFDFECLIILLLWAHNSEFLLAGI
jgi:hypothetical protein